MYTQGKKKAIMNTNDNQGQLNSLRALACWGKLASNENKITASTPKQSYEIVGQTCQRVYHKSVRPRLKARQFWLERLDRRTEKDELGDTKPWRTS